MYDLVLKNAKIITDESGIIEADIAVADGKIVGIGAIDGASKENIDCYGLHILPGLIDTQVHFREPGNTHKEDLETGTLSAIAGGITSIFEMPNTAPLTTSKEALFDKIFRADGRAWCNFAFFIGGTKENAQDLPLLEKLPACAGVKVFMGSSTGNLLTEDDETLMAILKNGSRRVAIHAEDENKLKSRKHIVEEAADVHAHPLWRNEETAIEATRRLLRIAYRTGRQVHVLHVTTAKEMQLLAKHNDIASVEVTPQHLTLFAPDCYDRLGTLAQMNPPIRNKEHQDALWQAVEDGIVDIIGSDHAPHTVEEKKQPYPKSPSGMPGVQTLLPIMLSHVNLGKLSLERLVELTAHNPRKLYGIKNKGYIKIGYDADFTIVDMQAKRTITNDWIRSKCGWTPYHGLNVQGWPIMTIIGGKIVMKEDKIIGDPVGSKIRFIT